MEGNKKISLRQFMIVFLVTMVSPATKFFVDSASLYARQSAWLVPIVAFLGFCLLLLLIKQIYKNNGGFSLAEIMQNVLTKPIACVILFIYFAWIVVLASVYTRLYAERMLSLILPQANILFLFLLILIPVYLASRAGFVTLARFCEICFLLLFFLFIVLGVLLLFDVDFSNLLPITHHDLPSIGHGSLYILAIMGYFVYALFFSDKIANPKSLPRSAFFYGIYLTVFSSLFIIFTVGVMGTNLTNKMSFPFFIAVKNISVLAPLNHLEPVILAFWSFADFIIIAFLALTALKILKSAYKVDYKKVRFISPILIILIAVLAFFLFPNAFALEKFLRLPAMIINLCLSLAIPLLLLIVGKIRKRV